MVILEEETYKRFGYYPCDLKPQSNKKILAACDDCGKIREFTKQGYHSRCHSCAKKEEKNPNWKGGHIKRVCLICGNEFTVRPYIIKTSGGKYCSSKCQGMAYSKLYIGRNHPNWKGGLIQRICLECGRIFYTKPSEVKKGHGKYCSRKCSVKVQRHNTLSKKTKPELIFEEICKRNDLPFHYVGDGSLWIGDANPDFIHNTRKIVVEVYGDYWHSPLLNGNIQYNHTLEGRRKQLKAEGHKLIVFWESDLKRKDAEAFVLYELTKQGIL